VSPAASDSELLEGNVDRLITRRKFLLAAAGALGVPFVTAPRRAESRVEPVPAKTLSADDLVNRIGVNLHFSFTGWVPEYDQNVGEIISLMQAANIWWARDHAYYEPGHPNDAERSARFKALQAAGIKLCFIALRGMIRILQPRLIMSRISAITPPGILRAQMSPTWNQAGQDRRSSLNRRLFLMP
jgi:hypothetical protein